jgi:hypothetical protein
VLVVVMSVSPQRSHRQKRAIIDEETRQSFQGSPPSS